jgi:hypothetical protein
MMETRLVVVTIAQRWRFGLQPDEKVLPIQLVILLPKNGIRMRLEAAVL